MKKIFSIAMLVNVAFVSCITASVVHAEEDNRPPLEQFQGGTHFHLLMCQIETKLAIAKVKLGTLSEAYSTIGACVKKGKSAVKILFPKANVQFVAKPEASKLLKEYYVQWLTAMDGLSPISMNSKLIMKLGRRMGSEN
ncbi:MAG: hypothetical protein Q8K74_05065 [Candidatus Nitrotoga sp.]|nr:hypothetical protein [Candidatus Nitrotoga sp.]MDP1855408.1 hypothetical protein [Candidatus Nitrotoga sp.]